MSLVKGFRPRVLLVLAVVLAAALALEAASTRADTPPGRPASPGAVEGMTASNLVLNYQGRLLDPATGNPKPNGSYAMSFNIYDVEALGSPLWTENRSVPVTGGLFSTLLGDVSPTPLPLAIFDGRALWLGVTVGADPEATPRMRLAYAPYALHAEDAVQAGNASLLGGQPPSAFAAVTHNHFAQTWTGGDPTPGLLVNNTGTGTAVYGTSNGGNGVYGNSGSGYGGFFTSATDHGDLALGGAVGRINTDPADQNSDLYLSSNNDIIAKLDNDGGENAAFRIANSGGTNVVTVDESGNLGAIGTVTAARVAYASPRTHHFVVGGEGFVPSSNVDYENSSGTGGAYIVAGSNALVAAVHLPHGAVVTAFRVFFNDTSASDMNVWLARLSLTSGSYSIMADVASTGISGYGNVTDTTISDATIDNTAYGYLIRPYSSSWNPNLKIMGALVTYTIAEAP